MIFYTIILIFYTSDAYLRGKKRMKLSSDYDLLYTEDIGYCCWNDYDNEFLICSKHSEPDSWCSKSPKKCRKCSGKWHNDLPAEIV